tara:strand:- start:579 stop:839 length:261 start_codon:yes stop_codon:yes gene_type:complete
MKIFKLFKEIQSIKDVLALIFTQQVELNHQISTMQTQLDRIESTLKPAEYEEFIDEYNGDIKISADTYNAMCDYLEEDEIQLMGLT